MPSAPRRSLPVLAVLGVLLAPVVATAVAARPEPSSILRAAVVPSGATMTITPSAPPLANTPSFSIAIVSGLPGPSMVHGCARTASTRTPA